MYSRTIDDQAAVKLAKRGKRKFLHIQNRGGGDAFVMYDGTNPTQLYTDRNLFDYGQKIPVGGSLMLDNRGDLFIEDVWALADDGATAILTIMGEDSPLTARWDGGIWLRGSGTNTDFLAEVFLDGVQTALGGTAYLQGRKKGTTAWTQFDTTVFANGSWESQPDLSAAIHVGETWEFRMIFQIAGWSEAITPIQQAVCTAA